MEESDIVVYNVNYGDNTSREQSYTASHASGNKSDTVSRSSRQQNSLPYHGGGESSASRPSGQTTDDQVRERPSFNAYQRPASITAWDNNSLVNHRTPSEASWRNDYFGPQRLGRAQVIFTGKYPTVFLFFPLNLAMLTSDTGTNTKNEQSPSKTIPKYQPAIPVYSRLYMIFEKKLIIL